MELGFLKDCIVIIILSIAVVYICSIIKIPSIIGFMITGIIAGPNSFGLVGAMEQVKVFSEIGVVLLLFTIGIEFSFTELIKSKKFILVGGFAQVGLTIIAAFIISKLFNLPTNSSIFIGFLICLSSTAIVLKVYQSNAMIDSIYGKVSLSILIFQDIIIIPMILLIPLLTSSAIEINEFPYIILFKILGVILFVIIGTKWIIPKLFYLVAKTRIKELFLFVVIALCSVVPWLTHEIGLSLAIGAFIVGMMISETDYNHQTLGLIIPFKDIFTSFFFISIGMLFDINYFLNNIPIVLLLVLSIILLKSILSAIAIGFLRLPLRIMIIVGFSICQIGEFSFVLSQLGYEKNLLSNDFFQLFLSTSIFTMLLTPSIINLSVKISDWTQKLPIPEKIKTGRAVDTIEKNIEYKNHLIIVGYGVNGKNVAKSAKYCKIPYVIIEMNPGTVKTEKSKGEPIYFGDATYEAIFDSLNIQKARVVVIAINDPAATRRITKLVSMMNPHIYTIVRTRYLQEITVLKELGAKDVVPEEFETSIEIFTRVLRHYLIPKNEIENFTYDIRESNYNMFRNINVQKYNLFNIPEIEVNLFKLKMNCCLIGKSIAEVELRSKFGVTVLGIQRELTLISNPDPKIVFEENDVLILLGKPDSIINAKNIFN